MSKLIDPDDSEKPTDETTTTDRQRREMAALVALGVPLEEAAAYIDANSDDLLLEALCDDDFKQTVAQAERNFEVAQLRRMAANADKHWNCAAWLLERRFPERYVRPKAGGVSKAELKRICQRFVDLVTEVIPDADQRDEIERRLRLWVAEGRLVGESPESGAPKQVAAGTATKVEDQAGLKEECK